MKIPPMGLDKHEILEEMRVLRDQDIAWEDNRAFSLVFHHTDAHTEFLKSAHNLFFSENGLNPMAFKSLRTFEHEAVRMSANLLNGAEDAVGTMTTGGTESIMLAVKTYRDRARKLMPWIRRPEMVIPITAHVAFEKAGKYFDVRMVHAPLTEGYRLDLRAMERLINNNTLALVGSAPNYPNGMIDPIEELGAFAEKYRVGLHVDACVGGFFLPWAERLGKNIPPFDFRVPGVTSVSADLHKYGYAAKGASVILYRGMDYLRHQFFVYVNWPGGVFASPSMPGTRSGGSIAAAWAALNGMGESGYLANAVTVLDTTDRFIKGIERIQGLRVLGSPPVGVFAYNSFDKRINIYAVADEMAKRGWHIDRQQKPPCIHLMINPGHAKIVDQYLQDLEDAVETVRDNPHAALSGSAPAYGLMAGAPMRGLVEKNVLDMMEAMYGPEGKSPDLQSKDGKSAIPAPVMAWMRFRAGLARMLNI
ncbi:MAG: aspartate aminotransferase family protein [Candidatus Hydrogenedentes bacterium]|nr:aspartate aminotransferase family protein [Candidatus Hydrogenedentota bacterium]